MTVTRVQAGDSFVAAAVVAGESGHQLLTVSEVDLDQEGERRVASEDGGSTAVMRDDHLLATPLVRETNWSTTHRRSLALLPWEAMCTL